MKKTDKPRKAPKGLTNQQWLRERAQGIRDGSRPALAVHWDALAGGMDIIADVLDGLEKKAARFKDSLREYDPNSYLCGRMCIYTVRLDLLSWGYGGSFMLIVTGNVSGHGVIEAAVEQLDEEEELVLTDKAGGELIETLDDRDSYSGMVVCAEIIKVESFKNYDQMDKALGKRKRFWQVKA